MKHKFLRIMLLVALMATPWVANAQTYETLPYTQDFEGLSTGSLPTGWTAVQTGTSGSGTFPSAYAWYGNARNSQVYFEFESSSGSETEVVALPYMQDISSLQLVFWGSAQSYYLPALFEVGVLESDNSFTPVDTINFITSNSWGSGYNEYTVYFANYTGSGERIAMRATGGSSQYTLMLEDFTVSEFTGCYPLSSLAKTDGDSASITVSWTDNMNASGTTYTVSYWKDGSTDTTVVTGISLTEYTAYNLDASSAYHFMVAPNCADGDGDPISGTFRTDCGAMTLPFTDDFESYANGSWPACWHRVRAHGTDPSVNNQYNATEGGSMSMYLASSLDTTLFVSPSKVSLPGNEIYVSYKAYMTYASYYSMTKWIKAGVMTDTSDMSTFIALDSVGYHDFNYSFEEREFTTATLDPDAEYWVAWMFYSSLSYMNTGGVDDVVIRQDNGCNKPNFAAVDSVGPYSAYFSWSTGGALTTDYNLYYGTGSSFDEATNMVNVSSTDDTVVYELTDLLPQTTYRAWVRTMCGSDSADAKFVGSFTTQMTCAPVLNAATGNISYTAAQVSWEYDTTQGFPAEEAYLLLVDNTDSTATPIEVWETGTSYTFSDLAAGHAYTLTIRSMCQTDESVDTAAAVNVSFMTRSCAEVAGDGSMYNQYVPTYCYYGNSYSQAIYPADDMPNIDTIHGIAYNIVQSTSSTRTFDVYMGYSASAEFAGGNTFVNIADLTLVASDYAFPLNNTGWTVIPLDTVFVYDGNSNLVVCVNDKTNSWVSAARFAAHAGSSVSNYRDNNPYTPANETTGSSRGNAPDIRFVANCEVPSCYAPMVTVDNVDSNMVALSWVSVGEENEWAVFYKSAAENVYTSAGSVTDTFYTFTGLGANTSYTFRIGSICSPDTIWASVVVRTSCGSMSLPYFTGFEEDNEYDAPACWTVVRSYTANVYDYSTYSYIYRDYPAVSTNGYESNRSLRMIASYDTVLIASQQVPLYGNEIFVSFRASAYNYYGTMWLEAGVMTDLNEDSTFTPIVHIDYPDDGNFPYTLYEFTTANMEADSHYYVAFRYYGPSTYYYADVDNVMIREDDGCHRPSNLTMADLDSMYAQIAWQNDGLVSQFAVQYREMDSTSWVNLPYANINSVNNTANLYGLDVNTYYYVRVGTLCTTDTLWTEPLRFRTNCTAMTVPYVNSFENDVPDLMASCWSVFGATATDYMGVEYPAVSTNNAHSGSNALRLYYIENDTTYVVSDAVPLPGDSIYVSFWANQYFYTYGSGTVTTEAGVMTNPFDYATFQPMVTITGDNGGYARYEFNTPGLSADSTYYVAFRYVSGYYYNRIDIDDIEIKLDEGCMYPASMVATPDTVTPTVVVTWSNSSSATEFVACYSSDGGTTWSTGTHVYGTTGNNSHTFSGLTYSTTYVFRIGLLCNGDTLWSEVSASTICGMVNLPYLENFVSATGELPSCWDYTNSSYFHWNRWTDHAETSGDGEMMVGSYSAGEAAILPVFYVPIVKLEISYDAKLGNVSEGDGMMMGVYDDATGIVTWLDTLQIAGQSRENFVRFTYNYLNYAGGYGNRIAIGHSHNNPSDWGFAIDSIVVVQLPDCNPPENVTVHNTMYPSTADDVYFTWTVSGTIQPDEWEIYIDTITSTIPIDSVDASQLITVDTNYYHVPINMLADGAHYRFFVRSHCGGFHYSNWVELQNGFATDEFWMNQGSTFDTIVGCDFIIYDNGGPVAGYLHNSNSNLIIQAGEVGRELQLQGGFFSHGADANTFTVYDGIGTSGEVLYTRNDVNTTETIDSVLATSTTGAMTITFTSGYYAALGYELYIHCVGAATCPRPTNLQVEMTSPTTAHATWDGSASSYRVYHRAAGANIWNMLGTTTNSVDITSLPADTMYDFFVVAVCSATDSSAASIIRHFSTHYVAPCEPVSNVIVSDITHNAATIDWVSTGSDWEVAVIGGATLSTNVKPYTLTDLAPATQYQVAVRNVCSVAECSYSVWSDTVSFTTLPEPAMYTITVTTNNSAWGSVTGSGTYAEGTEVTITATANSGYKFVEWQDGNTDSIRTITVTADALYMATFAEDNAIADVDASASVVLYPNPASTSVTLTGFEGECTVTVVDLNGRAVSEYRTRDNELTIDLTGYAKGAYFVRVTGERTAAIRKLVVK